jgi:Rieske Fe-S protein
MKVRATAEFKKENVNPDELDYIPEEGIEFEVSEERFEVLSGKNRFKKVFVEKVVEEQEIETAIKKAKTEKAVKKTIKRAKSIELDLNNGQIKTIEE